MKTEAELDALADELRDLFIAKEVAPSEAVAVLTRIISGQMVNNTRDIKELNVGIVLFSNQLTMMIAHLLEAPVEELVAVPASKRTLQ